MASLPDMPDMADYDGAASDGWARDSIIAIARWAFRYGEADNIAAGDVVTLVAAVVEEWAAARY
jgi:hypothetical protein